MDKIFVGLPVYGGMAAEFVTSLVQLVNKRSWPMQVRTRLHDSLVTRSRNVLTADFLLSDCDRLLWLDTDLIFTADDVERICSHDVDLVGGMYPIKNYDSETTWCANGEGDVEIDERGLAQAKYVGTGFMCIRKTVFEQMIANLAATPYLTDANPRRHEWDFWSVGVHQGKKRNRYLSEDWMFCQRWLDMGGDVWMDTKVRLKHVGTGVWPLPHQVSTF